MTRKKNKPNKHYLSVQEQRKKILNDTNVSFNSVIKKHRKLYFCSTLISFVLIFLIPFILQHQMTFDGPKDEKLVNTILIIIRIGISVVTIILFFDYFRSQEKIVREWVAGVKKDAHSSEMENIVKKCEKVISLMDEKENYSKKYGKRWTINYKTSIAFF